MATNPKMKPCPQCHSDEYLDVYKYEGGWQHVECDHRNCCYLGPAASSIRQAIKLHNEHVGRQALEARHDALLRSSTEEDR